MRSCTIPLQPCRSAFRRTQPAVRVDADLHDTPREFRVLSHSLCGPPPTGHFGTPTHSAITLTVDIRLLASQPPHNPRVCSCSERRDSVTLPPRRRLDATPTTKSPASRNTHEVGSGTGLGD